MMNGINILFLPLRALCIERQPLFDSSVLTGIMILYGSLHLATGLSLIYGADKRRPSCVKFWLYTRYAELALIIGTFAFLFLKALLQGVPVYILLIPITFFAIIIGIMMYFLAVVRSFCHDITDSGNTQLMKEEI